MTTPLNRAIGKWQPRYNIETTACLMVGMGENNAFLSGYRHGWEGQNSRNINCLTKGTAEHAAWERGYTEGEHDRNLALSDEDVKLVLPN